VIGLALKGDKALAKALRALPNAIYNRVVRAANTKLMRPVLKAAKQRVPVEFGVLKESLGIKTKTFPKKGVIFTVVGARSGFHKPIGSEVKRKAEGRGAKPLKLTYVRSPTKYAHLVEFGHAGPHPAKAHPFVRPAWDGQRTSMIPRYRAMLRDGLDREVAKLKAKGEA
jgi:HK97 gp10 family phage protein